MHFKEICLPLILFGFVFYPDFSLAANEVQPTPININIDFGPIVSAINNSTNGISNSIIQIPKSIFDFFKNYFEDSLKSFVNPFPMIAKKLVTENPDIKIMKEPWSKVVLILSGFYVLAFVLAGLLMTMSFLGTGMRMKAKDWLKGAVIMIILIGISYEIYAFALGLSAATANYFLDNKSNDLFSTSFLNLNFVDIMFFVMASSFAVFSLFIRYVSITLNVLLFPIAIFLYFVTPLRPFGTAALYFIAGIFAIQPIDSLVLLALMNAGTAFSQQNLIWLSMSMLFLGFLNFAIICFSILISGFAAFRILLPK